MRVRFLPMHESSARAVVAWRYEPPYDFYDLDDRSLDALTCEANRYFAAFDDEQHLVGFCCYGPEGRVPGGDYGDDALLDLGVGLRPALTGNGLGPPFLITVMAFGVARFAPDGFRATVAAFNRRSIRACEKAGFTVVDAFKRAGDGVPFVVLTWPASG